MIFWCTLCCHTCFVARLPQARRCHPLSRLLQLMKHVEEQDNLEELAGPRDLAEGSTIIHNIMSGINKVQADHHTGLVYSTFTYCWHQTLRLCCMCNFTFGHSHTGSTASGHATNVSGTTYRHVSSAGAQDCSVRIRLWSCKEPPADGGLCH